MSDACSELVRRRPRRVAVSQIRCSRPKSGAYVVQGSRTRHRDVETIYPRHGAPYRAHVALNRRLTNTALKPPSFDVPTLFGFAPLVRRRLPQSAEASLVRRRRPGIARLTQPPSSPSFGRSLPRSTSSPSCGIASHARRVSLSATEAAFARRRLTSVAEASFARRRLARAASDGPTLLDVSPQLGSFTSISLTTLPLLSRSLARFTSSTRSTGPTRSTSRPARSRSLSLSVSSTS